MRVNDYSDGRYGYIYKSDWLPTLSDSPLTTHIYILHIEHIQQHICICRI